MTNLTPAQLEQFESTFRYFDKDESNTLNESEMTAALASLGIVYSDDDMDMIYNQLMQDYGAVTYEAFINLLVRALVLAADWEVLKVLCRWTLPKIRPRRNSYAKPSKALQTARSVPVLPLAPLALISFVSHL